MACSPAAPVKPVSNAPANYSRSHRLRPKSLPPTSPIRVRHARAAAAAWSSSRPSSSITCRAARHARLPHPGYLRRDPARLDTVRPHRNHDFGDEGVSISSAQKRSSHHQNRTNQRPTPALSSQNRTSCSQTRPLIGTVSRRPDQHKGEIPHSAP